MKKILLLTILALFLLAGSAIATPIIDVSESNGEDSLQTILNDITVGGVSSIDVTTDYLPDLVDSYWSITANGTSSATMIIELAGYDSSNILGVYDLADSSNTVDLFSGSATAGDQVYLSIKLDGSVWVDNADTGVDFAGNNFGYYLDSPGGFWYSDSSLNGGDDHMAAYQGNDSDSVQLPGLAAGLWTDNEFILAFEDLAFNASNFDSDYNDMVLMVESVNPVPEPATILLLGSGLIGLAGFGRKRFIK